jgi:ABC-2 type transport system ATP-binding protein
MSGTSPSPESSLPKVGDPLVEFQDLNVCYGPVQALVSVSGAFPPGPTGLLGPNGAGKTTLLKTLLGFLTPDSGRITAFGLDPGAAPLEVRRKLGYMPEVDCHIAGMSAATFVAFAGELSGMPRDEAISRAHEVLYYVGLGEARYRTVDTYSTGMKQRVKLAQALVHDPDLLLLDEPYSGFDWETYLHFWEYARELRDRGRGLLVVSHFVYDRGVFDRVLDLAGGRLT